MSKTMEERVSELEILVAKLMEENTDTELHGAELAILESFKNRVVEEEL